MKSMFLALALALPLALAPAARAGSGDEDARRATKARTIEKAGKKKAQRKKIKRYDFEGDKIHGDGILPAGDRIFTLDPFDHGSLIKVRTSFRRQVLRSAEESR